MLLKKELHISPGDRSLYEIAFTPKSMSRKQNGQLINNARLEYLGDAVFTNLVSELLYRIFPDKKEGELSKIRAKIISRDFQEKIAVSMGLDKFYEPSGHKPVQIHLYANTLEALFGALFLDKGYRKTRKYFLNHVIGIHIDLDRVLQQETDYKSLLTSWCQQQKKTLVFKTEENTPEQQSPAHFVTVICIDEKKYGIGKGRSKKTAEQNAAERAWKNLIS